MTSAHPPIESISAFFPCYNDEATITSMVNLAVSTIERVGAEGEVIVVNDGSIDGSAAVLRELSERQPWLRVITHDHNRGYGGALISGFAAASRQWVFYTDGDAQFDPSELELLAEHATADVDVVQGYKISRADNVARRVIGRVYHRFVSFVFGLRIRDTDCDFRLIRRSTMEKVRLEHDTGVICVEMVRKLQDAGARFVEVPIHHYPRLYGRSKFFRLGSVVRSLRDLVALWVQLVVLRRGRIPVTSREHDDRGTERQIPVGQAATLRRGQGSEDAVQ
ncbi:MAG: glycosyltransferase family 2 protein [Acidimicrobiia bacterium]